MSRISQRCNKVFMRKVTRNRNYACSAYLRQMRQEMELRSNLKIRALEPSLNIVTSDVLKTVPY